jgi:class 3 adenylate cyclase/tetratricopeptide (TPR) repeat protein
MAERLLETQDVLVPYLPRLAIQWMADSPQLTHRELEGSVAFVDISGFTKLSERLARLGKVGAEELADAINTCFNRLLGVAYANGGNLIKFGGDALLLFFTGVDHEVKACRAAIGMRRALREIGRLDCSGVSVALRMSVGVNSGTYNFFLVGESHRELIVTGPAASQTVLMESTAEAGEIVVSEATAAALPPGVVGDVKGPGRLLRKEPHGMSPERIDLERGRDVDLVPCIPRAIREHLLAGLHEPEHRRVTVAFLHFDETDRLIDQSGPEVAAAELHRLVADVQRAVDAHELCFLASDIDRDGGKLILTGGAPKTTGNDEERMLLAMREVVGPARAIPVRVGINNGSVFAGDIGPSYRRTYTIMGDAVNLAARVMAKAQPGQILATEPVLKSSRTSFDTTALEPFMVKGKSQPVNACSIGDVSHTKRTHIDARVPLIGREEELAILQGALDSAREGRGRLVEIIAEPGMGKSRLLDELRSRAGDDIVLNLACELYQSSTPYFPFQRLLRIVLGINEGADDGQTAARLREVMAALTPDLVPWAPLVAGMLGVEGFPDTEETRQLGERFRRPRSHEVVRELLARLMRTTSLVTIEDAHWMDEASTDLLHHISSHLDAAPWMICVTRRDVAEGFASKEGSDSITIRLQPLDAAKAAELVTAESEDAPFPPHQIAALAERSGGNPLFLKELLAAARSEGIETLPDSVEGLLMARIDRLAPTERNLLRRASVVGRSFHHNYLSSVLEEVPLPDDPVWDRISEFVVIDNGTLSFVHALIRDAAYEGLPYRLRKNLHSRVGDSIERAAGETPDEQAELLSLHFFHAQRFAEAWRYSLAAAERAKAIYANMEASEFYERALRSARHIDDLTPDEVARIHEALGDVRNMMSSYAEADKAYRLSRKLIKGDSVAEARLLLKVSTIQGWMKRDSVALRSLSRALHLLSDIGDQEAAAQRARVLAWYARFRLDEGRMHDVINWCNRAIHEARQAGEKEALADAYRFIDCAYMELGQYEKAIYSTQALALYEELGDLPSQAIVFNNLGLFAYWQGQWDRALELYERGSEISKRTGDVVNAAFIATNKAQILCDQGRLEEAEKLFTEVLRIWQPAGYRRMIANAKNGLALVCSRQGRHEEARRLLDESIVEAQDVGAEFEVLDAESNLAEAYALEGNGSTALRLADEALTRARALADVAEQVPRLLRIRGFALAQTDDLSGARDALEESLKQARSRKADYEVALSLRALGLLATLGDPPSAAKYEQESQAILERLHVVQVQDAPLSAPIAGA